MATITVTVSGTIVMVGRKDTVIIDIPGGGDVTIIADPSEKINKIAIEFVGDDHADSVSINLGTFNSPNLKIDIKDYDPSDSMSLVGAYDTYVDPANTNQFSFSYTGADGEAYAGVIHARDKGEKDFTADPPPIAICFAAGTLINTNRGWVPVEDLKEWDCAHTVDHGLQPIRWIGHRHLNSQDLEAAPHLRPIKVAQGALGNDLPDRPLVLSPNHRVLVSGWRVEMMFGETEVLVPIKSLINGGTIQVDEEATEVDYYHLLLDEHELIFANGIKAESLLLAGETKRALRSGMNESHEILQEQFSELEANFCETARPALRAREAKLLSAA